MLCNMYRDPAEAYGEEPMKPFTRSEWAREYTYAGYASLGGRIDEENYQRVMKKALEISQVSDHEVMNSAAAQTKHSAEISGVSLDRIHEETGIDPRAIYAILRNDIAPDGVAHHHVQMSDQQLLVEALRMLEQEHAVRAVIKAEELSHISFN